MRIRNNHRLGGAIAAAIVLVAACLAVAPASAQDVDALESRVADARGEAEALGAELAANQEALIAAQQAAAAAAARESELTALLAVGRQRAAELGAAVSRSRDRLDREKRRLGRARAALAARIVAIYKTGSPDLTDIVLSAESFGDLVTRSDYLRLIEDSDASLAQRVEQVRDGVAFRLGVFEALKERVDAYNARIDSARATISAVRAGAEAEAGSLAAARADREATLATLRSSMEGWIDDIQAAQAAAARESSEESAAEEVGRWLGGPYSIPTYIVSCESGGNYSAVNPSSGAGGAYQIIPSTWDLYGGEGNPEDGSKDEQDEIAAQIWADSGPGAWVCAG